MGENRKQVGFRLPADLVAWLRQRSAAMPHDPAPGRKRDKKLNAYVELILETHRKGQRFEAPAPDPYVIQIGEWFAELPSAVRPIVLLIGTALAREVGDSTIEAAAKDIAEQLATGKLRSGRRRRTRKAKVDGK